MFSCILVPTCRYSHFHNLAHWTGDQACSYLVWCVEFTMVLYTITYSILCLCCMEWPQRNKVQITLIDPAKPRVYWIFVTKLMVVGSIFGYKTEVVMRIAISFAYNLEYLLRLTKLKYTHIFTVDFHGSRIYQMKEKIMFFIVMYCCNGIVLQS